MERRLFERRALSLNAILKGADGLHIPCVIRDFCTGGLLVRVSGDSRKVQQHLTKLSQGTPLTVVVPTQQHRFQMEAVVSRVLEDQLGLQLQRSNPRMIEAFRVLHERQQSEDLQSNAEVLGQDELNVAIGRTNLAMPQAKPDERDRSLAAMQDFTRQFMLERLTAFFSALEKSRNDVALWGAGIGGNNATDIVDLVLKDRRVIVEKFVSQVLPFFTVDGLRDALERIDKDEEIEYSTQMSLVDKDEFEEWLHIKVLARRLEDQSQEALTALAARIRYLIGIVVTPATNGLTPESWVNYLRESLNHIQIDFNTLKIILDCYREHLLEFLKIYYSTLNTCLDDNGILPGDSLQEFINNNARNEMLKRRAAQAAEMPMDPLDAELGEFAEFTDVIDMSAPAGTDEDALLDRGLDGASGRSDGSQAHLSFEDEQSLAHSVQMLAQLADGAQVQDQTLEGAEQREADFGAGDMVAGADHSAFSVTQLAKRAYSAAQRFVQSNLALTKVSGVQEIADQSPGQYGGLSIVDAILDGESGYSLLDDSNAFGLSEVLDGIDLYQKEYEKRPISIDEFDTQLLGFMRQNYGTEKHWDGHQANSVALTKKLFMLLDRNKQISDKARARLASLAVITFKALLIDSDALIVEDKPVRSLLNLLAKTGLKGAVMHRGQDAEIQHGISVILNTLERDFSVLTPLIDHLSEIYRQQVQFFERNIERLRETCEGQYRITLNREKVESAIDQRLSGRSVPYVIKQLIECGWRDLMYFSLMKEGEQSKGWNIALVLLEDLIRLLSSKKIRMDALRMMPDKMMVLIERGLLKVTTPQNAQQQKELIPQLKLLLSRQAHLTPEDFEPWQGTVIRPQMAVSEPEALRINISAITDPDDGIKPHLEKWLCRAEALALGSWLDFQLESGERMAGRLLWRAEDDSRLVFVNRQGMKLSDISMQELAEGLHRGDVLILTTEEEPSVERGLDSLVQEVYSELANEVSRDELTNLLTRREIERLLDRHLEDLHVGKPEFFVIYVRVDQLSSINASCGYEAGDEVLKQLAERLFDTSKTDENIGRSSGTDFVVAYLNASPKAVLKEADRLLASIMAYRFEWEEMQFSVGASIGVVEVDEHYQSVDSILMDAQSACLTAMEAGGNRVQVYSRQEQSIQRQQNRIVWASKVDEVLQSSSLRLKVQKIAPTQASQTSSPTPVLPHYEVLIGSLGDSVGSVFDFISAAERYKRMGQVDRWIVEKVCNWMDGHREFLDSIGGLSINLSGNSLNDGEFIDHLFEVFAETQVPCDKLCFEITETVALENLNDTVDFMKEMKNLGCRFAMDDFGTGMSSFAYLKHLPVDYLKVDGAFVKDMQSSRHDMAMVKSITDMGHLLGKKVVAEYVVDAVTLKHLESIGVDYCQGFYIEEPIWFENWQDDADVFEPQDRPTKPSSGSKPGQGVA